MKNFKGGNERGGFGFKKGGGGRDFKKGSDRGGVSQRGTDDGLRPKFGGDRHSGGGFKKGGDRKGASFASFDKPELFSAVCATCGKACEVPFRPSNDKPVYCSACFGKKNSDDTRQFGGEKRSNSRSGSDFKKEYRPVREARGEKSFHQEHAPQHTDRGYEDIKKQLVALESKVNSILELLTQKANSTVKAETETDSGVSLGAVLTKIRKPKTVKVKTSAKKKVSKKAITKKKK